MRARPFSASGGCGPVFEWSGGPKQSKGGRPPKRTAHVAKARASRGDTLAAISSAQSQDVESDSGSTRSTPH